MAAGIITDDMLWTARADDLLVREYDDTYIVYFRPSGDTHILNFLSYGIVQLAAEGACQVRDMSHALRQRLELDDQDLPDALILKTVSELDDLGLIVPRAAPAGAGP